MNTDMNRASKMKQMRSDGMSLQEIADVYSISRERVRQIIGNTGKSFLRNYAASKLKSFEYSFDVTRDSVKNNIKRFKGMFLKKLATVPHKIDNFGQESEIIVSNKLKSLGLENKLMRSGYIYDILLSNGFSIDVKSTDTKFFSNSSAKGTWKFGIKKEIKGDYCDFFIFHIKPENVFFVIPNQEIDSVHNIYIPWPITTRHWTKWGKYKDRFDLLKK